MKTNYHTHTYRCKHATMCEDEIYVQNAIKAGFSELAFTDHIPFPELKKNASGRMDYDEIDDYISSVSYLKEKYKDQIKIYLGFEVEYFPDHLSYYRELRKKVDILILGQHYKEFLDGDFFVSATDDDLEVMGDLVEEGLKTGLFDVFCHPDLFMISREHWNDQCDKLSHRLAKVLEETQIPAEINLNGCAKRERIIDGVACAPYPYRKVWEIFSKYHIKAIIGYDAHNPDLLLTDKNLNKAKEILKGLKIDIIDHLDIGK